MHSSWGNIQHVHRDDDDDDEIAYFTVRLKTREQPRKSVRRVYGKRSMGENDLPKR